MVGVEFLGELGELPHLPGEPVDAVDAQQVDAAVAGEIERRLKAGPVELRTGRPVLLVGDDPPVPALTPDSPDVLIEIPQGPGR